MSRLVLTGYKNLKKIFTSRNDRRVSTRSFCAILLTSNNNHQSPAPSLMDLNQVVQVLEYLAPLSLAESWDNVGLLVEPSKPRPVKTILLTNDLTDTVMEEAEAVSCDLIVSYHPPLFQPIKRLVQKDWKQRLVIRALEAGMAVFSPHTSWDSVRGGVNDWLVGGLGHGQVSVLSQAYVTSKHTHIVEFKSRTERLDSLLGELKALDPVTTVQDTHRDDGDCTQVRLRCSDSVLTPVVEKVIQHIISCHSLRILKLEKVPLLDHGQGRLSVLDQPVTVATAVQKMKSHLGLRHLRLALGQGCTQESFVRTVAVCAGSGTSVLKGVQADLYITGEMSHHEVLDAVAKGTSVILSDHSNSERGYLAVFREKLTESLPANVAVMVSKADRDPLVVV
ncbi:NIF3-like protein 1 isoform X2 [Dunckerocampus dactyliophorus]|uniref:NIF3-like protein 1 isoform X1 n=2 Tax=Dunckerocampus dactyliophorus TaxID=161453 RepID=UPI002406B9F5|nr:NIF3-like protein 1 isoform X1 [Dunckerocampus dactyliophorus]XP_054625215.1 NIF3-like protein 1 isoform X2 [Dunckerocampus dactyliophorus]